jgi:soluble lytic murein transglycosylase-like protein
MKRFAPFLVLLLPVFGLAQSTADYLKLRKQYKIVRAAEVAAVETTLGSRVMEVEGTVKGVMSTGTECSLFLEKSDSSTLTVDSDFLPDFLDDGEVRARLILKISRPSINSPVKAKLLAIALAPEIAKYDEKPKPVKKPATTKTPTPPQGRGPLYGPIGRQRPPKQTRAWNLPASEVTPIYASFIKSQNRRLSDREAYDIASEIIGFSLRYGVDARLIMAMVMVESGFDPTATSRTGAQGLGQLMPGTARGLGVSNSYDSTQNLYGTVKLVRSHLETYNRRTGGQDFDTLVLTLAAYNAGPGAVRRHGGIPPYRETQNYVRKVVELYRRFSGA